MKLETPFIKLPFLFDAARMRAEIDAIPAEAWVSHPNKFDGNSALRLITSGGGENDDTYGAMAPTPHLAALPCVQQVLAHFGVVWSRSRLMRLGPGAKVPPHADIAYHWHHRVRIHIPVTTDPGVRFFCGEDASVHMAEGETWIFDNWRTHRVENNSDITRVHLVADTTGSGRFWDLAHTAARREMEPVRVPFQPDARPSLMLERHNVHPVMPPSEVDDLLRDLLEDTVSYLPGPAGQASIARLRQILNAFRHDWRQLWSVFASRQRGLQRYRDRVELTLKQIEALGDDLVSRSNSIPVSRIFMQRLAVYAVNPQLLATAPVPASAQA